MADEWVYKNFSTVVSAMEIINEHRNKSLFALIIPLLIHFLHTLWKSLLPWLVGVYAAVLIMALADL